MCPSVPHVSPAQVGSEGQVLVEGALAHTEPQSHKTRAMSQVGLLQVSNMQEAAADTSLQQRGLNTRLESDQTQPIPRQELSELCWQVW